MSILKKNKKFTEARIKIPSSSLSEYYLVNKETLEKLYENSNSSISFGLCLFWFGASFSAVYAIKWDAFQWDSAIYVGIAVFTFLLGILYLISFYKKNRKARQILESITNDPCELEEIKKPNLRQNPKNNKIKQS